MSTDAPQRFKPIDELTPADHDRRHRTGELPETPEFAAYRVDNPELFNEEDGTPRDPDEWTPQDHAKRKYGGSRA